MTIDNLKAQIAFFERREAELAAEEAATPVHRPEWRKLSTELRRVRRALRDLRSQIESEEEYQAEMAKIRAECTPEEWAYLEEMTAKFEEYDKNVLEPERKAREKREREAEKRRDAFEIIDGGKSD